MRSASVALTVLLVVVFPAVFLASATEFLVGDDSGWSIDVDYEAWASGKKFFVGDTLVFKYEEGSHTVVKVDGTAFAKCLVSPNNTALSSGNDRIIMGTPGNKWYICGVADHCDIGQKLKITVLPRDGESPSPSPLPAPTPISSPPECGLPPAPVGDDQTDVGDRGYYTSPELPPLPPLTPAPWGFEPMPPMPAAPGEPPMPPMPAPWPFPMPPMPAVPGAPPMPPMPAPWAFPMPPMPAAPGEPPIPATPAPWAFPMPPMPAIPAPWAFPMPPMPAPWAAPSEEEKNEISAPWVLPQVPVPMQWPPQASVPADPPYY